MERNGGEERGRGGEEMGRVGEMVMRRRGD